MKTNILKSFLLTLTLSISFFGNAQATVTQQDLHNVIKARDLEQTKATLDALNINMQSQHAYDLLVFAIIRNRIEIIELLLERGLNANLQNKHGETALMYAVSNNRVEIAKLLIANGANVNAQDSAGGTALMGAVFKNSVEIAEFLIASGADVNLVNKNGYTALMGAVYLNSVKTVELLIANGADVSRVNKGGRTALMIAKGEGYTEIQALLEKATNVEKVTEEPSCHKWNPLCWF